MTGLDWHGPVPDPDNFEPMEPAPNQKDIFVDIDTFDKLDKASKTKPTK